MDSAQQNYIINGLVELLLILLISEFLPSLSKVESSLSSDDHTGIIEKLK